MKSFLAQFEVCSKRNQGWPNLKTILSSLLTFIGYFFFRHLGRPRYVKAPAFHLCGISVVNLDNVLCVKFVEWSKEEGGLICLHFLTYISPLKWGRVVDQTTLKGVANVWLCKLSCRFFTSCDGVMQLVVHHTGCIIDKVLVRLY